MKQEEVSERYHIPKEVLNEYEKWGLCGSVKVVMGDWQYDDQDLERLGTIMALYDIGFCSQEIENYMRLLLEQSGTEQERLKLLEKHRGQTLDEIHFKEKQVEHIDYLRHKIRKNNKTN